MNLRTLKDTPAEDWPDGAGRMLLSVLRDDQAAEPDLLLATELAGDATVIDDALVDALLSILRNTARPETVRFRAAMSLAPVLGQREGDSPGIIRHPSVADSATQTIEPSEHEPPETTLRAPKSWGPLELRRTIGQGRFGTVHVAWDPGLEREVALKILRRADQAAAVVQEARLLARVRHPNVVTVYGVDTHDDAVGLWMELVEGLTLKQVLSMRGVLGAQEAALIGIDLCRAVAAVHKAGLLHRDIKVHNVMREAGGRVVLMDFGAGEIRAGSSPGSQIITGTPVYVAPEVFSGAPATIASDVYGVGVVLYHLVTMRYPVEGETVGDIAAAHAQGEAVPLADRRPSLPASFVRIVERALDRNPARRYRSSGAMQQDLVSALELESAAASPATRVITARRRPGIPSMAVLPFANLGPDQGLEYFCNGLAEELLTALGKVPGLRVASRTSSLAVKQTDADIRSICRQLEVDAVLEGTVRKAGNRLRITAQLVSAEDGCHLWSEGYDREMADVFAVQEEIAQSVVDRLRITLTETPSEPLVRRHTDSARAYHLYLKGRFYWLRRHQGGLQAALDHFQQAIEEDAGYALAHTGVADAFAIMGFYSILKPRIAFANATAAAERALEIDADLPEAHTSLAFANLGDWNWTDAERQFARALELDPNQAMARIYWSWLMVLQGDIAGATVQVRTAQETEPLSPLVNGSVAHTFYLARRYDEAVAECEKALEIDPGFILASHVLGMCRALQGRLPEAVEIGERLVAMSGRAPLYLGMLAHYYARGGATDKIQEIVEELDRLAGQRYIPPHCFTYIHAGLNEIDLALEWQARAYADGASPFNYYSPLIANLHADPRHADELRRMRLRAWIADREPRTSPPAER
jgi:eukaryotic-like serine/threonine-protein kinase